MLIFTTTMNGMRMSNNALLITRDEDIERASRSLKAMSHPLRLKILEFIDTCRRINVNKIYNTLKIEQSITSQHLRILRMAGLVNAERDGKFIHYTVDYNRVEVAQLAIDHFYGR